MTGVLTREQWREIGDTQRSCEDRIRSWAILPPAKEIQDPLEAEKGNRESYLRLIAGGITLLTP